MPIAPLLGRSLVLPEPFVFTATTPGYQTTAGTLDATAEKFAMVFQCPKAGTLDTVELGFRTVSINASSVVRVSFQDVDPATGDPDGTQDQFRDLATDPVTNTWQNAATVGLITSDGTDTGTKRTVVAGEVLAVVVEYSTFTAADSVVVAALNLLASSGDFPYTDLFTASWAKTAGGVVVVLKYDDGTYHVPPSCCPASALNTTTFNSGSTPDERGLLFRLPFPARLAGLALTIDLDGDADFVLYDASDVVRASASRDKDLRTSTTGGLRRHRFGTPWDLDAGVDYRLVVKPTSATSLSTYDFDANSNTILANWVSANWQYTQRTNAGAWTDTDTKVPFLFPLFTGFHDGTGSGGALILGG